MLSRICSTKTVTMNETIDTDTEIVIERLMAFPAARLYGAWTKPEIMQKWLAPEPCSVAEVENDLRLGGKFRIVLQGPNDSQHVLTGLYLELVPNRRVAMTWLYTGPIGFLNGVETRLEVDLIDLGDGTTRLALTQRRIPSQQVREAFEADWPTCFDKLQRTMEHTVH